MRLVRLDHSSTREAPADLVRRLREVEPTAELVYMLFGRWVLGSVRDDGSLYIRAGRMKFSAKAMLDKHVVRNKQLIAQGFVSNPLDHRSVQRLRFAELAMQGFRPIAEYRMRGEPDGRIVNDLRRMDWLYRNTTDDELDNAINAPRLKALEESRAEFGDHYRGADAWRYAFNLSHSVTRHDDPTKDRGPRSGFTRVSLGAGTAAQGSPAASSPSSN